MSDIRKALERAFSLGQTYWQQADSDSYSQNRKADETRNKFLALADETAAALAQPQAAQPARDRLQDLALEAVHWIESDECKDKAVSLCCDLRAAIYATPPTEPAKPQCHQVNSGVRCTTPRNPGERLCPDCNPSQPAPQAEPAAAAPQERDANGMMPADPNCKWCKGSGVDTECAPNGTTAYVDCVCRFRLPTSRPAVGELPPLPEREKFDAWWETARQSSWNYLCKDRGPTPSQHWMSAYKQDAWGAWQARAALASAPHAREPLSIDYEALLIAAQAKGYRQGSGACIAFARGAEWFRNQIAASARA